MIDQCVIEFNGKKINRTAEPQQDSGDGWKGNHNKGLSVSFPINYRRFMLVKDERKV